MQEVASCAKGANTKGTVSATGYIAPSVPNWPLLLQAVHKEAAASVHAVASSVEGAAQLRLVLGVARGHVEVMQAMSKLATLCVLAGTTLRIAAAQLGLVAGGTQPGVKRRRGRLNQRKQSLSQGLTPTSQALSWEKGFITTLGGKQQQVILAGLWKKGN